MGHLGLTPQSVNVFGGFKVQGKTERSARALLADAAALEEAGVFAIVLELVPAELSRMLTERLSVPTIGIGAGPYCDGEVQVIYDVMGLFPDFTPRHTKRFADLGAAMRTGIEAFLREVRDRSFPGDAQSAPIDPSIIERLRAEPSERASGGDAVSGDA
jgi:3-methyl-2-oxobutanoate hydroxymethyltransferase